MEKLVCVSLTQSLLSRYITTSVSMVFLELGFVLKKKNQNKLGVTFHSISLRRFAVMTWMCGLLYWAVATIRLIFMVLVGEKTKPGLACSLSAG